MTTENESVPPGMALLPSMDNEQVETAEGQEAEIENPYAKLAEVHPLLAHVTKDTLADYMVFSTTWMRHREIDRPDSILQDNLSAPLTQEIGEALLRFFPEFGAGSEVANYVAIRAHCIDRALVERDPIIEQIVIVGAKFETRPFRCPGLDKCVVYEIQTNEDVMNYKEEKLQELGADLKAAERHVLLTDLGSNAWQDALLNAGFDRTKPTFWLCESTLQFLKPDEMEQLIQDIDDMSAPRSQLVTERVIGGGLDLELDEEGRVNFLVFTGLCNGENAGIFASIRWKAELLARRNRACQYYGTMWDPHRFDRLRVTEEEASLGPWFIVLLSKPEPL